MMIDPIEQHLTQNDRLPIRMVSPTFGHLGTQSNGLVRRLPYYFFVFMVNGSASYGIDGETYDLAKHELFFGMPHQVLTLPATGHGTDYYKLGFDEECLSRLPRRYAFLLDPLNQQKIRFSAAAASRLISVAGVLQGLLTTKQTEPELILAHLNSLLAEIDTAYFAGDKKPANEKLAKFIGFKLFVENHLTHHPAITAIAEELSLSPDSLYQIVKQYTGHSPKDFLINRLILEARRRMHYGERTSVKELAFELGFNDPDYFSRLFKKVTGKTVAQYLQELS